MLSNLWHSMKTPPTHEPTFNVALFPESSLGASGWIAKAIDAPLVAQGASMEDAKASFLRVFKTHLILCGERGELPLLGIKTPERAKRAGLPERLTRQIRFSTLAPA